MSYCSAHTPRFINFRITLWTWKSDRHFDNKSRSVAKPVFSKILTRKTVASAGPLQGFPGHSTSKHATLLLESFHQNKRFTDLLEKLNKEGSCPLQQVRLDGDWPKQHFWAVVTFLRRTSSSRHILQVFNLWMDIEKSRINEHNYEKIIGVLGEEGLMEDAVSALVEMRSFSLVPSLQIYNSIIHVCAKNGKFDDALFYLNQMKEINLSPESDTYNGLIEAYGKHKMYDELGLCLKRMQMDGCPPDKFTYNLLIQEFGRGGLLSKMEKAYGSLRKINMNSYPPTLIAMVEAYANFGVVEKMERVLRRIWYLKIFLKEDLIRKVAGVYIENYMFSRLHDLANDIAYVSGWTDLVWCLRLLSAACLLSRRGMDHVVKEMEEDKVSWNVTVPNIILLSYLKMKDFTRLRNLLVKLPDHQVEPDIITFGILFDAMDIGFDETGILRKWRKMGFLNQHVEMDTDPLVLTAFGKGPFLRKCEEAYASLDPQAREKKRWTYYNLIDFVGQQNEFRHQWNRVKSNQEY